MRFCDYIHKLSIEANVLNNQGLVEKEERRNNYNHY